ncbi:MAG: hypothetical protein FWD66_01120 [Paludibacter sp.]|nr:hypothetical protein [Paludibacter sp.]
MIATVEDIKQIRPIADNINAAKRIQPYINDAEHLDIMPIIGVKLYRELDSNRLVLLTSQQRDILLQGCYYDNNTKYSGGLLSAITYLAYSRFLKNNQLNVTAFGAVVKQGDLSEPADEKTIMRMSNEAYRQGLIYLNQCVDYLKFYNIIPRCSAVRASNVKFKAIGL